MTIDSQTIASSNYCQIAEMEKLCASLDPNTEASCIIFTREVRGIESAIVHTYQITAFAAIREKAPDGAASMWAEYKTFCGKAIEALKNAKEKFPHCGTGNIYNLALDYWNAASERQQQNENDAKCLTIQIPPQLFPK